MQYVGFEDLLSFTNIGPNEILSMLQAVANAFSGLAGSSILQTQIPFTGKTLGDVLAYGTAFKERILDPLFVSGDLMRPDNNGDGAVDTADLNFSSIQSLITRLETALGLSPGTLGFAWNGTAKTFTFTFNFSKALGFGEVEVSETQRGGGGPNEKQTLVVNGVATPGVSAIGDTFRVAFPDANDALQFTDPIPLGSTPAFVAGKLALLSGIGGAANVNVTSPESSNYRTYVVEFVGGLANTNMATFSTDAVDLAGSFALDFGAQLGSLAGITTSGSSTLLASLVAGMTFGLDLNASQSIEVNPGVYSPAIDVRVALPAGATTNTTQILTVSNVNGGTYDLTHGSSTITALYNESAANLQTKLNGISGVTSTVSLATFGNHRIYTINFSAPSAPQPLVANPAALTGPSTNGRLTGNATFTVDVLHPSLSVSDGVSGHTAQTIAANTAISGLNVTVNVSATSGNTSLADLGVDVRAAVNSALAAGGYTPGWLLTSGDAKSLSTGALTAGANATAAHDPLDSTKTDVAFTVVLQLGTVERKIAARVRAVDLLDTNADGSLFNGDGTVNTTELNGTFGSATLASKLQAAIADALSNAGIAGFTFTVTVESGKLKFSVTGVPTGGDTIALDFLPAVQVDAGGGRVAASSPSITLSPHALRPGIAVGRVAQISTPGFTSVGYQELGLQSAPTSATDPRRPQSSSRWWSTGRRCRSPSRPARTAGRSRVSSPR